MSGDRSRSRSPAGGADKAKGTVARWNEKGFGFIKPDDGGEDIFCHFSNIEDGDVLTAGAAVSFIKVFDDRKGKDRAEQVTGGATGPPRGTVGGGFTASGGYAPPSGWVWSQLSGAPTCSGRYSLEASAMPTCSGATRARTMASPSIGSCPRLLGALDSNTNCRQK